MNDNSKNCPQCRWYDFYLFEDCAPEDLRHIFGENNLKQYKRNAFIFREDESATGVFCLCSGNAKIVKNGATPGERIISLSKPGDILGLRSVISEQVYSTSAIALENVSGCFIPKNRFLQLIKKYPTVFMKIMRILCLEMEKIEQRATEIIQKSVPQRVAETLLMLHTTYGKDENNFLKITMKLTDLANLVNTSRFNLYRIINHWKRQGILNTSKQKIQLLDIQRLHRISE